MQECQADQWPYYASLRVAVWARAVGQVCAHEGGGEGEGRCGDRYTLTIGRERGSEWERKRRGGTVNGEFGRVHGKERKRKMES